VRTYTAVVKIGDGSKELGLYRNTFEIEAPSPGSAKKKALSLALSSTFVTVELSEGRVKGVNEVYEGTFGKNPEPW
jgi:hypothetical protein